MENKSILLDGVTYVLRPSNFIEAKKTGLMLLGLLKGGVSFKDGQADIDFGAIVSNLNGSEMEQVQNFVLKYCTADGIKLLSNIEIEEHFNKHRSAYFPLMFEGVKYHFADFLPVGGELLKNISLEQLAQAAGK